MDPDELDDDQMMRALALAITAVSGISSNLGALIINAETVARYIETGENPYQ